VQDFGKTVSSRVGEVNKVLIAIGLVCILVPKQQFLQSVDSPGERLVSLTRKCPVQVEPHRSAKEHPSEKKHDTEPHREAQ
jgi:hypothetical protein